MDLLVINACPRGEGVSRTRGLLSAFLDGFRDTRPGADICLHDLEVLRPLPLTGETLARREALIEKRAWDDPMFTIVRDFVKAESVVIAAPYWDLMFPASLKAYIEHIFVRELTFVYRNDAPVGLCTARRALFLTTAGSPMGQHDFGARYLEATLGMLGIPRFDSVCAEGIDLAGADITAILQDAAAKAMRFAAEW